MNEKVQITLLRFRIVGAVLCSGNAVKVSHPTAGLLAIDHQFRDGFRAKVFSSRPGESISTRMEINISKSHARNIKEQAGAELCQALFQLLKLYQ